MAGTGVPGFSGNKGPATKARLRGPAELAKVATPTGVVADADSVYLGDTFNHRSAVSTTAASHPSCPSSPSRCCSPSSAS